MAAIVNARDTLIEGTVPRFAPYTLPPEIAIPISQVAGAGDLASQNVVGLAQFAQGIQPVGIVNALPDPAGYTGLQMLYLTTDGQIYRYLGGGWTTAVKATSVTGQLTDEQLYSIAASKLNGQITGTQITDGAIVTAKLAAGAVTAASVAAGAITTGALAANAVTAAAIDAGAVTAGKIAAGSIGTQELTADAVTAGKIAAGAVTALQIAANAISADKIGANQVTADKIDGRGLAIRDLDGNILFGAGTALNYGNVQGGPPANATNGAILGTTLVDEFGQLIPANRVKKNLIDSSWWLPGADPSRWLLNGGNNRFENWIGPNGALETVWVTTSTGTGAAGGWDISAIDSGNSFPVDITKAYRFCLPIKKYDAGGSSYWGIQANSVCDLNTANPSANPYFAVFAPPVLDRWYLFVGYVYPAGSTGNTNAGAGVYDMTTGALVAAGLNFCWRALTVRGITRAYQYYTPAAGISQMFGRPQVEMCDGTEVPLASILATGSVSARNPINYGNASTYIANAAIGTAQIANAAIGNAQIGGDIFSSNWSYDSAGWYLQRSGAFYCSSGYFRGDISAASGNFRGQITGGAFTGYAWPAVNNYGFYLGPSGLLLGNANNGKYFQITADGNIYSPGFYVENGTLTINQANVINTLNLAGNAVTLMVGSTGGQGTYVYGSFTGRPVFVSGSMVLNGTTYGDGSGYVNGSVSVNFNGNVLWNSGTIIIPTPYFAGGSTYAGSISVPFSFITYSVSGYGYLQVNGSATNIYNNPVGAASIVGLECKR